MELPENIEVIVNEERFTQYIFSGQHFTGKYKAAFLNQYGLSRELKESLIVQLKQFPGKYKILSAVPVRDNKIQFRFIITGQLSIQDKPPILVNTVWLYTKEKQVHFLNLFIGEA